MITAACLYSSFERRATAFALLRPLWRRAALALRRTLSTSIAEREEARKLAGPGRPAGKRYGGLCCTNRQPCYTTGEKGCEMSSNGLVEDLARHMHRQHAKTPFGQGEIWAEVGQERRSYWRQMARSTFAFMELTPRTGLRLLIGNGR